MSRPRYRTRLFAIDIDQPDQWGVEFWIGNQGFRLDFRGNDEEAMWMERMLSLALHRLETGEKPS